MAKTSTRDTTLEQQAVAVHRAYLKALMAWENLIVNEPDCVPGSLGMSRSQHAIACKAAELHKERCRIAFRDLIDELGYIPRGHGVSLGDEPSPKHSDSGWTH